MQTRLMIHLGHENWSVDTKLDGNFHPAKFESSDLNSPQEKLDSAMFRNAPITPLHDAQDLACTCCIFTKSESTQNLPRK